ncbi:helix-hairpin-helix domain-containing protein [Aeromonas hydrophila]|uniref:helix-hairpin-helix domain-containing protein n=1 Tax=Aeromonas hydrophila TaxID=644 RepID=UPI001916A0B1|nr:helix-hairpin-helix domain-containing protein [Aeromonas hydrophila]MBQ4675352.1 helix-hairpin-helix domain-containing protein [Aeromonas hydrophila]MBW3815666.1 helix-hairpin-helix domain-containing protein [Aeromonas hydrophila]MCF7679719.1 helix-hairpin-helix domain-containing protein [Aeromonas hydrophila]MCF7692765.1 helix-hairpin-helix domain-containing protein [Aeromonas hydrophila]MCF7773792.1 helix-hairpin-helix domain-containing protein [Aeromonas hydrophila]
MKSKQGFSGEERALLLGVKGVGPAVIGRLEQLGYHNLAQLAEADTGHIVQLVASMLGSTCWQNSPQARAAIDGAIALARSQVGGVSTEQREATS